MLLVAHNARQFDAGFLQAEYRRLGRELPDDWRFVDTLPLARKTLSKNTVPGGSYKLESLAGHFGVTVDGAAHRAEADARMLGDVLQGLVGCSLEGTAGRSIGNVNVNSSLSSGENIEADPDAELADAVHAMKTYSFSMGDPAKNSLRRQIAGASAPTPLHRTETGRSGGGVNSNSAALGFGATPIVTSVGEDIDVESSANIPESELDDLTYSGDATEDDDADAVDAFFARKERERLESENSPGGKPKRRPFWVQVSVTFVPLPCSPVPYSNTQLPTNYHPITYQSPYPRTPTGGSHQRVRSRDYGFRADGRGGRAGVRRAGDRGCVYPWRRRPGAPRAARQAPRGLPSVGRVAD